MSLLVTALMVVLGLTVLAGAAALRHVDREWRHAITDSWTLELNAADPGHAPSPDEIDLAVTTLRAIPGIVTVRQIEAAELDHLLQPWLGDPATVAQLPLPALFDIAIDPDRPPDPAFVDGRIRTALPNARLDDHQAWTRDLSRLARTGEAMGLALFAIVIVTATLTVAATARARLAVNRPEIELLHRIGASDAFIAQQFESGAFRSAVAGALLGLVITAAAGAAIVALGPAVAPLAVHLRLTLVDFAALAAVPVGIVVLATLVTRSTARALLRRLI